MLNVGDYARVFDANGTSLRKGELGRVVSILDDGEMCSALRPWQDLHSIPS